MTFVVPLQILLEKRGGGDTIDITKYCTGLRYGSRSPGGYAAATFQFHRKLREFGTQYGQYSPLTVLNTETGGEEYEGLLDDPGRSADQGGESFRMAASGVGSTMRDIERPLVCIDSSLESWGRGLAPAMREQVSVDTDTFEDAGGPAIVLTAPAGMQAPAASGLGYVHYMPMINSRQLIGSVLSIDIESGQDDRTIVGHIFGLDTLPGVYNAFHVSSPEPTQGVLLSGAHFGFANTCALGWSNAGGEAVAGDACWTRWGGLTVKPILATRTGGLVVAPSATQTTWYEVLEDLIGASGQMLLIDGNHAYLDDAFPGRPAVQITHLIYPDGVTPAKVLEDLLQIERWATWLVWGKAGSGYLFEWTHKPTSVAFDFDTLYEAVDIPGGTAEMWNLVTTRWRDEHGNTRMARTFGNTSPILAQAGMVRGTTLDLGDNVFPGDVAANGDRFLAAHATPIRSGTITVTRPVYDQINNRWVSPWQMPRVGPFRCRVAGTRPGATGDTPNGESVFDVVACEYDADANAAICELDQPERWVEPFPVHYGDRRR